MMGHMSNLVTVPEERPWVAGITVEGLDLRVWDVCSRPSLPLDQVRLVVLPYLGRPTAMSELASMPELLAVQTLTAGYEGLPEQLPPGVVLCNAAGVHDASTAELAVGLAIAGQRGIGLAAREQTAGAWNPVRRPALADSRVLVVGVGGVGTAICERLEPFDVAITRVARSARTDELTARFGAVHGFDELPALLPQADVVILAVPLTEQTRGMFGAELLAAMPTDSLLVSVARGPVVDTAALTAEVSAGRLRAAVDVIDPEPFPADHALRQAPGFLLTPHLGGNSTAFVPRALRLLNAQLSRLVAGQELANVVHRG